MVFLLTVVPAVVLLAAGFLVGLLWLPHEPPRLDALREQVRQKSVTMQQPARGHDADSTARGELPPTGRHYQAG